MKRRNPRTRRRLGVVACIEGLAVWILAIFAFSYTITGSITWPGTDMYVTTVGTMGRWLSTPGVGFIELVGYLGLTIAVGGPLWIWLGRPLVIQAREWWETAIWIGPGSTFEKGGIEELSSGALDESELQPNGGFDSVEEALANGDFLRGSGDDDQLTEEDGAEYRHSLGGPD